MSANGPQGWLRESHQWIRLRSLFFFSFPLVSFFLSDTPPGCLRCDKVMLPLHDFQHFLQRLVLIYVKPFDGRLMFAPVISARGSPR